MQIYPHLGRESDMAGVGTIGDVVLRLVEHYDGSGCNTVTATFFIVETRSKIEEQEDYTAWNHSEKTSASYIQKFHLCKVAKSIHRDLHSMKMQFSCHMSRALTRTYFCFHPTITVMQP